MSDDPYSRLYWRFADEFADIYADDATFALWCRLLIIADMAWPTSGAIPFGIRRKAMNRLVEAELIVVQPGNRFRLRGIDKEREARSDAARTSANARWSRMRPHSDRNANAMLAEPSLAEPSRAEPSSGADASADALDTYYRLTGSWPSQKVVPWLNRLSSDHGEGAVCIALAADFAEDTNRADLLSRVETRLERESHEAAKRRAEAERKAAEAERRRIEEMPPEKRAANMARLREMLTSKGVLS